MIDALQFVWFSVWSVLDIPIRIDGLPTFTFWQVSFYAILMAVIMKLTFPEMSGSQNYGGFLKSDRKGGKKQ